MAVTKVGWEMGRARGEGWGRGGGGAKGMCLVLRGDRLYMYFYFEQIISAFRQKLLPHVWCQKILHLRSLFVA